MEDNAHDSGSQHGADSQEKPVNDLDDKLHFLFLEEGEAGAKRLESYLPLAFRH